MLESMVPNERLSVYVSEVTQTETVTIYDVSRGGAGVARLQTGQVVFVPWTDIGDELQIEYEKSDERFLQGNPVHWIKRGPDRIEPKCPYFSKCGGCDWQHIPYERQWKIKVSGVQHALGRQGVTVETLKEFPAELQWAYRNRAQLRGRGKSLGFFARGSNTFVGVDRCAVLDERINTVIPEIGTEAAGRFVGPYKVEVALRESGEVEWTYNQRHSALGFQQGHSAQNQHLKAWVATHLQGRDVLVDLYGGNGNLSADIATRFQDSHCVDVSVPDKIEGNPLEFHRSDVDRWLKRYAENFKNRTTAVILDPPRAGLGTTIQLLAPWMEKNGTTEIVHIGCDADAAARDISRLTKLGFTLADCGVVDLFPQTAHVEVLAYLVRRR